MEEWHGLPTVATSRLTMGKRHHMVSDKILASTIPGRLVNNAYKIRSKGASECCELIQAPMTAHLRFKDLHAW